MVQRRGATSTEGMRPIVAIGGHGIEAFADRREERALGLEQLGQHFQPLRRKVAKAIEILGNQPLFGLDVAAIGPLEQGFPAAENLEKVALAVIVRPAIRVPRRLPLRGYCGGQGLAGKIPDFLGFFGHCLAPIWL